MLSLVSSFLLPVPPVLSIPVLAQTPQTPPPQEIVIPQVVRPLPGALDDIPVFNSNSPEIIATEGILLSTFPPDDKQNPAAHLDFSFEGRFDMFAHHVFKALAPDNLTTAYLGVIVYNPGSQPVTISPMPRLNPCLQWLKIL
jgi:hypothetical protein